MVMVKESRGKETAQVERGHIRLSGRDRRWNLDETGQSGLGEQRRLEDHCRWRFDGRNLNSRIVPGFRCVRNLIRQRFQWTLRRTTNLTPAAPHHTIAIHYCARIQKFAAPWEVFPLTLSSGLDHVRSSTLAMTASQARFVPLCTFRPPDEIALHVPNLFGTTRAIEHAAKLSQLAAS
jgi:hypothetical protein